MWYVSLTAMRHSYNSQESKGKIHASIFLTVWAGIFLNYFSQFSLCTSELCIDLFTSILRDCNREDFGRAFRSSKYQSYNYKTDVSSGLEVGGIFGDYIATHLTKTSWWKEGGAL